MKTFYEFRSEADPDLHGFTDEVSGSKLPSENGPWTFIRQLASEGEWPSGISKAVTAAGVLENGFSLSNYRAAKPIIASDRVEGTAASGAFSRPGARPCLGGRGVLCHLPLFAPEFTRCVQDKSSALGEVLEAPVRGAPYQFAEHREHMVALVFRHRDEC